MIRQPADWPCGSGYGKSGVKALWNLLSFGFPDVGVRHGCHCTLLFRYRQPSLGMDARCLVRLIHVSCAGGFISHAHDRQVFTALLQTISCSQDSVYRAVPDIPKFSAGQGLSSLTMNSSTRHRHSSREIFVGKVEAASRESRHSRFAVPSPYNSYWFHV